MEYTYKYYKLTDPITGASTKSIGYSYDKVVRDYASKVEDGKKITLKDSSLLRSVESVPCGDNVSEITKEEFDKTSTEGESLYTAKYRERLQYLLERQEANSKGIKLNSTVTRKEQAIG